MSDPNVLDPRLGASQSTPSRAGQDGRAPAQRDLPPPPPPPQHQHQQQQHQHHQQHQAQYGELPPPGQPGPSGHGSQAFTENTLRAELQRHTQHADYTPPQPYYPYPYPPQAPSSTSNTPQQQPGGGPTTASTLAHPSPSDGSRYSLASAPDASGNGAHSPDDPSHPDHPDNEKRARACEACRGLKVRCDQDPARPDVPCKRCAKAGRQCIITQPSRKRQKKADSRVAELEKKLDALTAVLHQQNANLGAQYQGQMGGPAPPAMMQGPQMGDPQQHQQQQQAPMYMQQGGGMHQTASVPDPSIDARAGAESGQIAGNKRRRIDDDDARDEHWVKQEQENLDKHARQTFDKSFNDIHGTLHSNADLKRYLYQTTPEEFVNRINTLMPPHLAEQVFDRYKTELCRNMPAVVFPPEYKAAQLFQDKPILYVCVMATASSGVTDTETSKALSAESVGAIADCVIRGAAKSLELIQALQVLSLWYRPPDTAEQANFYQIIHMSAIMALDIGLGKRFNLAKARKGFGLDKSSVSDIHTQLIPQDSDAIEARRAWVVSYYLCASASMVLRRPNLIRWTNYMQECLDVLCTSPEAAESDKLLAEHVKIQRICEDIAVQFLMDDNTANISITDPKVTYQLSVLEQKLQTWKTNIPSELRKPSLVFFEHVTDLYLHEIALHFNHNVEDFRLPFTEESLKATNSQSETLTDAQLSSLESCVRSAHAILDTFLAFDPADIKALPNLLYFVRCIYAIVVLIKMHVAVVTPDSELGKLEFLKVDRLRVGFYLKAFHDFLSGAMGRAGFKSHPKILMIWGVLMEWFERHQNGTKEAEGKAGSGGGGTEGQGAAQRQTGLQVLSQLAAGGGHQQSNSHTSLPAPPQHPQDPQLRHQNPSSHPQQPQNWTYPSPSPMTYPPLSHPAHSHNYLASHSNSTTTQPQQLPQTSTANDTTNLDPSMNPAASWGSDFEQAMDLALGSMGPPEGLDGWFFGEGAGSFGFGGEGLLTGGFGQGQGVTGGMGMGSGNGAGQGSWQ